MKSIYLIFLGLLLNLPIGHAQLDIDDLLFTNGTFNPLLLVPTINEGNVFLGQPISKVIYEESSNGTNWQRLALIKVAYSTNCQRILNQQECVWSQTTNIERCDSVEVYQYDNSSRLINDGSQTYKYVGSRVYPDTAYRGGSSSRYIYTYTAQNLLASETYQFYDATSRIYNNSSRDTYTYDNVGRLTQHFKEYYSSNAWTVSRRIFYTYNARNQIIQELKVYSDSSKTDVSYDALGRLTGFASSSWANNRWNLNPNNLKVVSFNAKNRPLTIEAYQWRNDFFTRQERFYYPNDTLPQRITFSFRRLATDPWLNVQRFFYEFCGVPTISIKEVERGQQDFSIFPNPAHDKLTINLKNTEGSIKVKATITDVAGRILIQEAINAPQAEINIGSLSDGLYLIILETANGRGVQKFVKN